MLNRAGLAGASIKHSDDYSAFVGANALSIEVIVRSRGVAASVPRTSVLPSDRLE